jgi:hypothetical protein
MVAYFSSGTGGSVITLQHFACQEEGIFVVLCVPTSPRWLTSDPWLPPLTHPTMGKRLRGRLLLALEWVDPAIRAALLVAHGDSFQSP